MKVVNLVVMFFLTNFSMFGQTLEEELGFKYVKAEYLFGTERYEDAIKELNDVIKTNPLYKNALLLRAETKYKLAAYKGAKTDALQYIEMNGVTMDAAAILGKSEYSLVNFDPALNSLSAAIAMGSKDEKIFEMRADIYSEKGEMLKACMDWEAGAKLGSTNAAINAKKNCGYTGESNLPQKNEDKSQDENNTNNAGTNGNADKSDNGAEEVISDGERIDSSKNETTEDTGNFETKEKDDVKVISDNSSIPDDDDTPNKFVVDEDLSIIIYGQGLGTRKILEKPSILILSEEDGVVAVEICVNRNGSVEYAEFNSQKSTLTKKSLVSLAIRKAKEFWFEKSDYPKQCGYIMFQVKGS